MLVNYNGKITMGDFYAHHQGQIIDASQIQAAYVRQNDTIYCLPAVSHLLLNMDVNSFCVPDQPHAGLFVPSSRQGVWKNDQDDIASWPSVQEENENSFGIYDQRYFFIGRGISQLNYHFADSSSLTVAWTASLLDTASWRSVFVLDADVRVEKTNANCWAIFSAMPQQNTQGTVKAETPQLWHHYVLRIFRDQQKIFCVFNFDLHQQFSCQFSAPDQAFKQMYLNRKTFAQPNTAMGSLRLRSLRLWNHALSDDELSQLYQLDTFGL